MEKQTGRGASDKVSDGSSGPREPVCRDKNSVSQSLEGGARVVATSSHHAEAHHAMERAGAVAGPGEAHG